MPSIKYDVSNVESGRKIPKPSVYDAKIAEASEEKSNAGNSMIKLVFEILKGEYKGSRLYHYIVLDGSQEWRMREFIDALKLKPKGTLDPGKFVGTVVQLRTAIEPAKDGYDEKARVKNVMPAVGSVAAGNDDDDDDDADYEEWSIEELKEEVEARDLKVSGKQTKNKLVAALNADDSEEDEEEGEDEEEEEGDEEESGEDEELTMEDLEGMDRDELKALIKEEGLKIRVSAKTKDDALRARVAEALEIEEGEDEEEEDEEEEAPPARKGRGKASASSSAKGKGKGKGRGKKAKPEPEEEEEEEEEGEDEEEETDYDEWDVSDLKAELKERGLKTEGRKSQLVARLKKDDAAGDDPF